MKVKQFGFTKGGLTTETGVELIEQIFGACQEPRDAIGVFCDLSKAFDCVHHNTLIRRLRHYGARGHILGLLESYLRGRIQRVDINGERSSGYAVNMGVPQSSDLRPFLFLVYINNLPDRMKDEHGIVLFADDTSLLFETQAYEHAKVVAVNVESQRGISMPRSPLLRILDLPTLGRALRAAGMGNLRHVLGQTLVCKYVRGPRSKSLPCNVIPNAFVCESIRLELEDVSFIRHAVSGHALAIALHFVLYPARDWITPQTYTDYEIASEFHWRHYA
ncbi:Probable RNA-directed DNA polymerase from transposon BS [Eumeta japonica]|uniref:Probable RNA-directed DNA polymerase from transposon BS n=1 Tax=Eumeta variegata TaxID=151549 RepID=A0A4C1ZHZ8_EUMVA|nr:Probable RNA-directed DNA polymerase from transposon BS [Eumeta japonica]